MEEGHRYVAGVVRPDVEHHAQAVTRREQPSLGATHGLRSRRRPRREQQVPKRLDVRLEGPRAPSSYGSLPVGGSEGVLEKFHGTGLWIVRVRVPGRHEHASGEVEQVLDRGDSSRWRGSVTRTWTSV